MTVCRVNAADTAWVLVSAGLVMFMTPGLALFYSGMIPARSMLNTIALTVACLGVVGVIWVVFGYSLAFGPDAGGGLIGTLSQAGLHNMATQLNRTGRAPHPGVRARLVPAHVRDHHGRAAGRRGRRADPFLALAGLRRLG